MSNQQNTANLGKVCCSQHDLDDCQFHYTKVSPIPVRKQNAAMNDEDENKQSILFRVHHSNTIYSVPVQHIIRVEPLVSRVFPISRSPDYLVGIYRLREKSISIVDLGHLLGLEQIPNCESKNQNLLVMKNAQVGFLVEAVLSVETLHLCQSASPFFGQFVRNVYFCDKRNDMILELDVPKILSLCQFSCSD